MNIERNNIDVSNFSGKLKKIEFKTDRLGNVNRHWMLLHGMTVFSSGQTPAQVCLGITPIQ